MKKDIRFPEVKGVSIAITHQLNLAKEPSWEVHLINNNSHAIENIFVSSKGYGINTENEKQETSTLRHHFQLLEANSTALIEHIMPEVFHLHNEYWVSYYVGNQIFDKKFIFVPDSIIEDHMIYIPMLDSMGVFHA